MNCHWLELINLQSHTFYLHTFWEYVMHGIWSNFSSPTKKLNIQSVSPCQFRIYQHFVKLYCNQTHVSYTHYSDVIVGAIASQITSLTIVYSTVYSGVDQRKHQSSASLAFVRVIHRWPVNYPHKWPVTRKMFPFDDVITYWIEGYTEGCCHNTVQYNTIFDTSMKWLT